MKLRSEGVRVCVCVCVCVCVMSYLYDEAFVVAAAAL